MRDTEPCPSKYLRTNSSPSIFRKGNGFHEKLKEMQDMGTLFQSNSKIQSTEVVYRGKEKWFGIKE